MHEDELQIDSEADGAETAGENDRENPEAVSSFKQPTPEQIEAFIAGDPLIIDEVARLLLPQLYRWAERQFDNLPSDEVQGEVHHALAAVCRNASRYDPRRALLTTYIINILRKRLAGLSKAVKDKRQEHPIESLELLKHENTAQPLYKSLRNQDVEVLITRAELFADALATLPEPHRSFLELMRQGEKSQEVYHAVLRRHGPVLDPAKEVKNTKAQVERILAKLARDRGLQRNDLIED